MNSSNGSNAFVDEMLNETNDAESPWIEDEGWHWFMWSIFVWLFPLMCLVGAIANAASFYVIASRRKSFPYVTRQYLVIITMSDFLTLTLKASVHYLGYMATVVKQSQWQWFTHPRSWGFGWCVAYDFFTYYVIVGSHFFQLGLTVDRLVAVAAPLKAKLILSHKRSWILLAVIAAMALLVPVLFVSNRQWDSDTCGIRSKEFHESVYQRAEQFYGRVFLMSLLMLGTVAMCALLAWRNGESQRMQAGGLYVAHQQPSSRERRRSLVRISFILVFLNIMFMATALPWSISNMLQSEILSAEGKVAYTILKMHFNTLEYLNNALNWPVYFMGRTFRRAFAHTFLSSAACLRAPGGSGGIREAELSLRTARPKWRGASSSSTSHAGGPKRRSVRRYDGR